MPTRGQAMSEPMTTAEAARWLGITQRRVQAMIKHKQLKAIRHGRAWYIPVRNLDAIARRTPGRPKKVAPTPPVTMKALTLLQPWATALAVGLKGFETRAWSTPYRGPVAIHAGKRRDPRGQYLCDLPLWEDGLPAFDALPFGAIIAVGELVSCIPTEALDVTPTEARLGDFSPGRFAWAFTNMTLLPQPITASGQLGLWTYTH
jgi:activating signal cointegrator 1